MNTERLYKHFPESPGVYLMRDARGRLLYVGKAGNLRRRVSSYFQKAHDVRIERLVREIRTIGYRQTDSALEALILESALIKRHQPPWNIREKDDKSFLYVEITKERFPRVLLIRGKELAASARGTVFGPFISSSSLREALRILRRIFPWNIHPSAEFGTFKRPCFDYELGSCPGVCVGGTTPREYGKTVRYLKDFFRGRKQAVLRALEREMKTAAKKLEFERAAKIRGQVFALRHIRDTALINSSDEFLAAGYKPKVARRIEGYDVSNISGTSAVGSMVVFSGDKPDRNEYRKFKIRWIHQPDDTGMLREVLSRRFGNDWPLPDLILIDGGKGQVNAAAAVLAAQGLKIPIVGIAKGPTRKKNEFVGVLPRWVKRETLIRVRDEAHRFAVSYHTKLRSARSFQ